jgi:hypothetical protein
LQEDFTRDIPAKPFILVSRAGMVANTQHRQTAPANRTPEIKGVPMRRLWLWDVANCHGVTDDEDRAIKRAQECMRDGDMARVELAVLSASFAKLTNDHISTGAGWQATNAAGTVEWEPLS